MRQASSWQSAAAGQGRGQHAEPHWQPPGISDSACAHGILSAQVCSRPLESDGSTSHIFDDAAATVACKQLGLKGPGKVVPSATRCYGLGKGPIHLRNVVCDGSEPGLQYCAHYGWGVTTNSWGTNLCTHGYDVGIVCNGARKPTC